MTAVDILVPVLGRPANAAPLIENIAANTEVEHTVTFLCSPGDEAEIEAVRTAGGSAAIIPTPPGPGDFARKINWGYKMGWAPFVFQAADDVEFTRGWDHALLDAAERTGAGMIGSNDDANPTVKRGNHSTHSLFRRAYIERTGATFFDGPGVVFHEGYRHQYVDTEAVRAAMDRGQWAFARRAVVRHHHPFFDKTVKMDGTYRKALGDAAFDSALYKERLERWSAGRRAGTVL